MGALLFCRVSTSLTLGRGKYPLHRAVKASSTTSTQWVWVTGNPCALRTLRTKARDDRVDRNSRLLCKPCQVCCWCIMWCNEAWDKACKVWHGQSWTRGRPCRVTCTMEGDDDDDGVVTNCLA